MLGLGVHAVMHYGISNSLFSQSVFSQLGCGSSGRDSDLDFDLWFVELTIS